LLRNGEFLLRHCRRLLSVVRTDSPQVNSAGPPIKTFGGDAFGIILNTVPSSDRLVESLDAFDELSLVAHPDGLRNLPEHLAVPSGRVAAQGLRILSFDSLYREAYMLATILIVLMILLQTGALSLGLMVDRPFIAGKARLNRKWLY
jgi:hypothetical protein